MLNLILRCKSHFLLLLLLCLFAPDVIAQKMRVQGTIRDEQKRPLPGAMVYDAKTDEVLGCSDDDGRYSAYLLPDGSLRFESIGSEPKTEKVKNRQEIDVILTAAAVRLAEVEIVSQVKNKIMPEPTDIEVKGNYFHLRTRFRIPDAMFKSHTRLIIQTFIYNVTEKERMLLRPLVIDGRNYTLTQKRMYGFDLKKDPLEPYLQPYNTDRNVDLVPFHDSTYIDNPDADYRAEVLMTLENFTRILYRDSFAIARGVINPLRFFRYDLATSDLTDEAFIPKQALQLCNDRGEIRLTFNPGSAKLDADQADNRREIDGLYARLREIENDRDARLRSFHIAGSASPEGNLVLNKNLASDRMKSAADLILSVLNPQTRSSIEVTSDARVESWERVAELLEKEERPEAAEVRAILAKHPGSPDAQGAAIRRLACYRPLIVEQYLPRLRRVEYQFDYSVFRVLNDAEIEKLYARDPLKLSRYEYYRLFECNTDTARLHTLYKQALALYPKFTLAANRLAKLHLDQGNPDPEILRPFIAADAPAAVLINHAVSCLSRRLYDEAAEVMILLPHTAESEELRAVVSVLNGDFESGYQRIAQGGGLNEVLLLMARKENEQAWEKAKALSSDVAEHEYIKAACANRLDKVMEALLHIENAFALKPDLKEIAALDGDVVDLLE